MFTREIKVDLAYLARKGRIVNPNGTFDKGSRWYPNEAAEGGTPSVRSPSRAWPNSYMVACRTKTWCAQLPDATLESDAEAGLRAIQSGKLIPSKKLAKQIASAEELLAMAAKEAEAAVS